MLMDEFQCLGHGWWFTRPLDGELIGSLVREPSTPYHTGPYVTQLSRNNADRPPIRGGAD